MNKFNSPHPTFAPWRLCGRSSRFRLRLRRIMLAAVCLLSLFFFFPNAATTVLALERHIHAGAGGTSPQELPLFVAKDLGIFEKYGLDVDLVVIGGHAVLHDQIVDPNHVPVPAAQLLSEQLQHGLTKGEFSFLTRADEI